MIGTAQLSLRLDADLKRRVEEAAQLDRRTVTDLVVTAIEQFLADTCTACGRSRAMQVLPPGMTDAFTEWLRDVPTGSPVTLLVQDPASHSPIVYYGELYDVDVEQALAASLFLFRIRVEGIGDTIPVPISKGLLLGWTKRGENVIRPMLVGLGQARDGNAMVAQRIQVGHTPRRR